MSSEVLTRGSVVDTDTKLRELVARGYQFVHPRNTDGDVVAVVGVRMHDSVVDVIRLVAEDDVVATRVPADEPDVLVPERMLWRQAGTADSVLDALLELPEDGPLTSVDTQPKGCWVPGDDGRAKWLSASA